ncbi:MAG: HD-like signal output (HDOD) protein [Planctomycetota bacterium]
MIDLDSVIKSAQGLAPLPESATRLTSLFSDVEWDVEDIAGVVRLDPPLTGRVLGLANSAAVGSQSAIVDVEQGLVRLGPGTVLALALGAGAKSQMAVPLSIYDLCEGQLWRHSVAVALAVDQARVVLRCAAPPEAFAAALLHDIGVLVVGRYVAKEDVDYVHRSQEQDTEGWRVTDAETEILGVHHGEVGGLVAESWGLPRVIVEGIAHHHHPMEAASSKGRQVADLVHLGDVVASRIGEHDAEETADLDAGVAERLGVTQESLDELCERVADRFEAVLDCYGG